MAFTNSHHFGIQTANIITMMRLPGNRMDPMGILHQARAVEATHTSTTASYAPKCKAGTRVQIITDIMDWVESATSKDPSPEPTSILWFSGPAGAGKTCIMWEVVKQCQKAGLLVWSYFFSARITGLDIERPLVATIVHQLTNTIPALKPLVLKAIADNPTIFEESMEWQMEKLLVEIMETHYFHSNSAPSSPKAILIIDGFDECRNQDERGHLLKLLRILPRKLPSSILIILASRPELDIRTAFDTKEFKSITHLLRLQDYDGTEDVRNYYCDEFERIRETHVMKALIPHNWPAEAVHNALVCKSNGHFILPSIVIKYVDNPRRNPVELLEDVMALSGQGGGPPNLTVNPLADLDALYQLILHPPNTHFDLMKRILHTILGLSLANNYRPAPFYDEFLLLPPGTTSMALCDLHSIISVPASSPTPASDPEAASQVIRFHHKSLEDYLVSAERSLDLFQSPSQIHLDITTSCIHHLQLWERDPTDYSRYNASTDYASCHWRKHLLKYIPDRPTSIPAAILEFDPRIAARFGFIRFRVTPVGAEDCKVIHSEICSPRNGPCVPLCFLLTRTSQCERNVVNLIIKSRASGWDMTQRIHSLDEFDEETGLSYFPPPTLPISQQFVANSRTPPLRIQGPRLKPFSALAPGRLVNVNESPGPMMHRNEQPSPMSRSSSSTTAAGPQADNGAGKPTAARAPPRPSPVSRSPHPTVPANLKQSLSAPSSSSAVGGTTAISTNVAVPYRAAATCVERSRHGLTSRVLSSSKIALPCFSDNGDPPSLKKPATLALNPSVPPSLPSPTVAENSRKAAGALGPKPTPTPPPRTRVAARTIPRQRPPWGAGPAKPRSPPSSTLSRPTLPINKQGGDYSAKPLLRGEDGLKPTAVVVSCDPSDPTEEIEGEQEEAPAGAENNDVPVP